MSPKALPTTTGANPLHRATLTPEQYAQLHHATRSKASRLLIDLNAKLEAELRVQHAAAVKDNADLMAEVEDLEAQQASLKSRREALSQARASIRKAITRAEETNAKLQGDLTEARALRDERDTCLTDTAQLQRELNAARREENRIKKILEATRTRTANLVKVIEDGEDDGPRRVLAMDNELVERRRRKTAERADAPLAAVTPLAG